MKRTLSLILAILLCFSLFSSAVLADDEAADIPGQPAAAEAAEAPAPAPAPR